MKCAEGDMGGQEGGGIMRRMRNYCAGVGVYLGCLALVLGCATQGTMSVEPNQPYQGEKQALVSIEDPVQTVEEKQRDSGSAEVRRVEPPARAHFGALHGSSNAPGEGRFFLGDRSAELQGAGTHLDPKPAWSVERETEGTGDHSLPSHPFMRSYSGKPISLDLLDADVRNVLRLIADITGTNMVIEPDVAGRVTLKVEQVPWDHVLDMVLAMNSLGKEREGNVIRVAREAKLREEWRMRTEAIRARQELMEAVKDVGELTTVYFTINYAQPGVIASRLDENRGDRGRVSIDERTSLVIYSDTPARIADARQLISRLDRPTSQVMIEARIVTMNSKASRDLGITWGLATDTPPSSSPRFQVHVPLGASATNFDFNIGRMIANDFIKLDARISALESLGDVRIIAAPNVMTLSNVEAQISQGLQIPYLQQTAEGTPSTIFEKAEVELRVTPHITPDRRIRMRIDAKQDEPGAIFNQQTSIETRRISTELFVEDGEIVVIGGVTRDRLERSMDGTPGFNRVPMLGRLFKTESSSSDKTQLLIFISPKIIDPHTTARR